jgi:lysozyme
MRTSDEGIKLIHAFESCKLKSYQDVKGVWTIGWGTTGTDVGPNMSWTQKECDDRFAKDLAKFEGGVEKLVNVPLTQNQFDALVCFAYNVGLGALGNSTLLKKLNNKEYEEAAKQFLVWNKSGGKVYAGLTRRREAEKTLFLKQEEVSNSINKQLQEIEDNILK